LVEAIKALPGDSRLIDATPVEVAEKDFCPNMPGFARRGYDPHMIHFMDSSDFVPRPLPQRRPATK
jgi:hypothetical protein